MKVSHLEKERKKKHNPRNVSSMRGTKSEDWRKNDLLAEYFLSEITHKTLSLSFRDVRRATIVISRTPFHA